MTYTFEVLRQRTRGLPRGAFLRWVVGAGPWAGPFWFSAASPAHGDDRRNLLDVYGPLCFVVACGWWASHL